MIVILCNSFSDAQEAYDIFITYLEEICLFSIKNTYDFCNCVETDDDLRYIFVDYRMEKLFCTITPDILTIDEFFEGIPNFYDSDVGSYVGYVYYDR